MKKHKRRDGFTIVELLIVIVIIGILATITVIAYNGITQRANEAVLKSDLSNAATQLEIDKANDNEYPYGPGLSNNEQGLKTSKNTVFEYMAYEYQPNRYCLTATSAVSGLSSFHVSNENQTPQPGSCDTSSVGDIYQSDFSADTDGWFTVESDDFIDEPWTIDYSRGNPSIASSGEQKYQSQNSLRITYDNTLKYGLVGKTISGLTPGETYVFRAKVYVPAGQDEDLAGGLLFAGEAPGGTYPGSEWVGYFGGESYGYEGVDKWIAYAAETEVESSSLTIYVGGEVYDPLDSGATFYYSDISVSTAD